MMDINFILLDAPILHVLYAVTIQLTKPLYNHFVNYKNLPFLATLVFCIVLTIFLFQPGYVDLDSASQLRESRSGIYDDWHPVLMAWTWSHVDKVCPGPLCMFLLQITLYWFGLATFAGFVSTRPMYKTLFLLIGFFPPTFMISASVLKDILMGVSFLTGSGLIFIANEKKSIGRLLAGVAVLGYGMMLRHNAVVAAIPLLIYAGYVYTKLNPFFLTNIPTSWRSIAIGCFLLLILFISGRVWSSSITTVKKYPYQQIMLHDLVGISLRLKENLVPKYMAISEQPSMKDLRNLYSPRGVNHLYWPDFTNIHYKILEDQELVNDLTATWVKTVIEHPRAYFIERYVVFTSFLNVQNKNNCGPYYYEESIYKPKGYYNPEGNTYSDNPVTNSVFGWVEPLRTGILYRNWLYFFALGVITLSSLFTLKKTTMGITLALGSSGFLYSAAYFFVATACDFRMIYWSALATLFSVPILLISITQNRTLITKTN